MTFTMELYTVTITQGTLQGNIKGLLPGKRLYSFQGIPYAKPPIGKLRFKPPQAPGYWAGVRDATYERNVCPQKDPLTGEFIGDEDCLYLNVYTPNMKPGKPLAVLVWIHGGAYINGSGNTDIYGPEYLVQEDVILVTLNYRLGALGFITLDIPEVPGNAGLRDQIEALRWVQRNISKFGGDPDNVTLFGESAGAACVHFLVLSPMGKGLFKRVIMQSGNALMQWSYNRLGVNRSYMLGELLGNKTKDPNELLNFLQKASLKDLVMTTSKMLTPDEKRRDLPMPYAPCAEKQFEGVEICLPRHPIEIIYSGNFNKVPVILGYNDSEGIAMMHGARKHLNKMDADCERIIPRYLNVEQHTDKSKFIAKEIKEFYFGNEDISEKTLPKLVDLMTDFHFAIGINLMAHLHRRYTNLPIYIYRFSYDGELNIFKKVFGDMSLAGACHGDELFYLFKSKIVSEIPEEKSEATMVLRRMVRLWANFAKYGNPTPVLDDVASVKWEPVTLSNMNYLNIGNHLVSSINPDEHRASFWKNMYAKCNGDFLKPKL